jgi:hypothetical protein
MRFLFSFFLLPIVVVGFTKLYAEEIYLERLLIVGNRVTNEKYIRSFLTLEEGKIYELDAIIDEINISRENLEKTNLFSRIFFNDQLDDDNNLVLTVQLKEKNYLFFGPTGFITYDEDKILMNTGLYLAYTNLFGNGGTFHLEIPLYENTGAVLSYRNVVRRFKYTWETEYKYSYKDKSDYFIITPGIGYLLFYDIFSGFNVSLNMNSFTSVIFLPYIEWGTPQRYSFKTKQWMYYKISPFYGINMREHTFYGIEAELNFYRDLLLRIVYTLIVTANLQDGEIPQNLLLNARVRGTYPYDYTGNKRISITNELHIPLPWNPRIVIVPFFDTNIIGYNALDFLFGGGVGFHWYTKFQDPFILEVCFGKAIMLNFQQKF